MFSFLFPVLRRLAGALKLGRRSATRARRAALLMTVRNPPFLREHAVHGMAAAVRIRLFIIPVACRQGARIAKGPGLRATWCDDGSVSCLEGASCSLPRVAVGGGDAWASEDRQPPARQAATGPRPTVRGDVPRVGRDEGIVPACAGAAQGPGSGRRRRRRGLRARPLLFH